MTDDAFIANELAPGDLIRVQLDPRGDPIEGTVRGTFEQDGQHGIRLAADDDTLLVSTEKFVERVE